MLLISQLTSIPNLNRKSLKMFPWGKRKRMDLKPMKYYNAQNNFNFHIILAILAEKI